MKVEILNVTNNKVLQVQNVTNRKSRDSFKNLDGYEIPLRFRDSRFKAFLPDGLDAIAEIVEDTPARNAAAGGQETADDTGDVTRDVKVLGIVDTDTLHAKAEAADAWKDDRLTFRQPMLEDVLQFGDHHDDRSLGTAAVTTGFLRNFLKRYFTLTDGLGIIFPIAATALDVVLDEFDVYCHNVYFTLLLF